MNTRAEGLGRLFGLVEDARVGEDRGGADGRIGERMSRNEVTQAELSGHLGCTQQFLSKVRNGRRRWPEGVRERAKTYRKAKEDVGGT
ncbi:MAG: hypothetical protein ABSG53_12775 [Thermoguttaceae bacterium]